MKEYDHEVGRKLAELIQKITGADADKVAENGTLFSLENPDALKEALGPTRKLKALAEFIRLYNEAAFMRENIVLDSSSKAGAYFVTRLKGIRDKEQFEVCLLNSQNRIIRTITLFKGSLNEAPVYPREILKLALEHNANSVILAHNHPGGSLVPSGADISATQRIKSALDTVSIKLNDHVIVGDDDYISFTEKGLI